jgi:hypothetical protein
MGKQVVLIAFLLFFLLFAQAEVLGEVQLGVKAGDWVEYNAVTSGNPPEEHNVTYAKLDVLRVQGSEVDVNVTTRARNGTVSNLLMTLNVEKGVIGAWWIIPQNLNPGQTFYDSFLNQNITINSEEERAFAGTTREVTNATVPTRTKLWDKQTGVFMVSMDDLPAYTINVTAVATNMWQPQATPQPPQICGLDPNVFYAVVIGTVTVILAIVAIVVANERKKPKTGAAK